MTTAKQRAAQNRFKAAAKQAKREGYSGKGYSVRIGEILRGSKRKPKEKTTRSIPEKSNRGGKMKNKITHGNVMDGVAIGGAAFRRMLQYAEHRDGKGSLGALVKDYTGIDPYDGSFDITRMGKGYLGAITRVAEKKAFRFLGIKGPRSTVKNFGDGLDYATYHGAAVIDAMAGRDNRDKFQRFYRTHYGMNLETGDYEISKTLERKWLPYILQKKLRQFISGMGVNINKILG